MVFAGRSPRVRTGRSLRDGAFCSGGFGGNEGDCYGRKDQILPTVPWV